MLDPVDIRVGMRIRARRLELGISQDTLAEAIGVTFQQLQKYESATNRVSASRIFYIARKLKVEPSYFFDTGRGNSKRRLLEQQEDTVLSTIESEDGRKLNEAFQRLKGVSLRRSIVDLIEKIADQQDASRPSLPEGSED